LDADDKTGNLKRRSSVKYSETIKKPNEKDSEKTPAVTLF
jgi:hypothetical protein